MTAHKSGWTPRVCSKTLSAVLASRFGLASTPSAAAASSRRAVAIAALAKSDARHPPKDESEAAWLDVEVRKCHVCTGSDAPAQRAGARQASWMDGCHH